LQTRPEHNFFPTAGEVAFEIKDPNVKLVCLCSPLNPCGTVIDKEVLRGICDAIVSENISRISRSLPPVHLMFDMVYWPLTYGEAEFRHPIELCPEISRWVIYVDAISKWMVSTGLRLGWAVVPQHLYEPLRDFMGHVGAWAPRPVQVATAKFLRDPNAFKEFREQLRGPLEGRLSFVRNAFKHMKTEGLPVESLVPQGAIYTSVRFDVIGKTTPKGQVLRTNDDIRKYLLNEAHVALVSFQAFYMWEDTGWFRISVGAVGAGALQEGLIRIRDAIKVLQ